MITKCNCVRVQVARTQCDNEVQLVRVQVARTQYDNEVQLCEGTGSEDAM